MLLHDNNKLLSVGRKPLLYLLLMIDLGDVVLLNEVLKKVKKKPPPERDQITVMLVHTDDPSELQEHRGFYSKQAK